MKKVICEEIEVRVGGPSECGVVLGTFTTSYRKIADLPKGGAWVTKYQVEELGRLRAERALARTMLESIEANELYNDKLKEIFGVEEGEG